MTAINMFRQKDSVCILTDTAAYDTAGIIRGFTVKCITIPHLRAAIATRGSGLATALFATNFSMRFQTFDDLVEHGGKFADEVHAESINILAHSGEAEVNIMLAGWSESRNQAEAYMLTSDDSQEFAPWIFHKAPDVVVAPVPSEELLVAAGVDTSKPPRLVHATTDGLKILEAQRAMQLGTTTGWVDQLHHLIGGAAVLTIITRQGIAQKVIHRWNDVIGEAIRPENIRGLSRRRPVAAQFRALRTGH